MRDTEKRRFLGIQALRIAAAFLVVCTHSTFYASERLDKRVITWEQGTRGVDIFFVISGFVMIYASQKLFSRADGWKTFAQHRIVRIVPLYWLLTTFKIVVMLAASGFALHAALSPGTAACSYLFLPSRNLDGKIQPLIGVGWTLTFEMFFYSLFTAALFLRANVFMFVGIILTVLSFGAYFRQPSWPTIAFYLNSIVLEFFFGMLIAEFCLRGNYLPAKTAVWLLAIGLALLLLPPSANWDLPKALINGLPAALIVWCAASLGKLESVIPRFVLYLGDASYAIYLIHPFVSPLPPAFLSRLHLDYPSLSVALSVALGVGLGCIVHQFIELPLGKWVKDAVAARRTIAQVAV